MARILKGRTSLSFFAQVRLDSFLKVFILTVRITLGHTLIRARPSYYLSVCNLFKERLALLFLSESGCKGSAYAYSHQTIRQIFLGIIC